MNWEVASLRRPSWQEIVTVLPDGTEEYWRFSRRVTPQALPQSPGKDVDSEELTYCQWPVTSPFREGSCSRNAGRNPYGLALCWQHEDAVMHHVMSELRRGRYPLAQVELLAETLFSAVYHTSSGGSLRVGQEAGIEAADTIIRHRLEAILRGDSLSPVRYDYLIQDLLDKLISERLQEKWGSE